MPLMHLQARHRRCIVRHGLGRRLGLPLTSQPKPWPSNDSLTWRCPSRTGVIPCSHFGCPAPLRASCGRRAGEHGGALRGWFAGAAGPPGMARP